MADIIITIPDDQYNRAINGICGFYGYEGYLGNVSKEEVPLSREDFAQREIVRFIISTVSNHEINIAQQEAQQAIEDAKSEVASQPIDVSIAKK